MRLQVKATGFDLTLALSQSVEEKMMPLEKFLGRWEKNTKILLRVEIAKTTQHHKKGSVFYAEANLDLPQATLRIEETNDDLQTAVEKLKDRLKNELLRFKDKIANHKDGR